MEPSLYCKTFDPWRVRYKSNHKGPTSPPKKTKSKSQKTRPSTRATMRKWENQQSNLTKSRHLFGSLFVVVVAIVAHGAKALRAGKGVGAIWGQSFSSQTQSAGGWKSSSTTAA